MRGSVRAWGRESVGAWGRRSVGAGASQALSLSHSFALTLPRRLALTLSLSHALTFLVFAGCRQDMHDQAKYKPFRTSAFFADGRASRPLVPDTVARGHLNNDTLLYSGKVAGAFADELPFPVTRQVLARGRERFDIFCSPCHDRVGTGGGMIVLRGYRRPPSLHIDRLRNQPVGYLYDVITKGFGVMPSYAQQIPVR